MGDINNHIAEKQNSEPFLNLLRSRQQFYLDARNILIWQVLLTIAVPVLLTLVAIWFDRIAPFAAASALIIALLDTMLIDRAQRRHLKVAAKISERFDCDLLDLPWNEYVAGKQVEKETINLAAGKWKKHSNDDLLRDWYPPIVEKAPKFLARIICQRTNLWYDKTLRKRFSLWILSGAMSLSLILFFVALASGADLTTFVISFLAPSAPILIWSGREFYRQQDAGDLQNLVKEKADELWEDAKKGDCDEESCLVRSRQFQDSLFQRRSTSPLMLPFVYRFARPEMEEQMNKTAEDYVKEITV